ncbi:MAG: hypothetical protein DRO11_01515 [Methanobacteriota archaeon]|nr:MAG: hypothetical protein DRO11_01515 [Euryarchaeota archaeon]
MTLKLTPPLNKLLKKPIGVLISGEPGEVAAEVREKLENLTPPCLISVGDVSTEQLLENGVKPDVAIVDGKTLRGERLEHRYNHYISRFHLQNPPGVLVDRCWAILVKAICNPPSLVEVDGEEDLLTLPAVILAPTNSVVVYGQPGVGMVVVVANNPTKMFAMKIVGDMEEETNGDRGCGAER